MMGNILTRAESIMARAALTSGRGEHGGHGSHMKSIPWRKCLGRNFPI